MLCGDRRNVVVSKPFFQLILMIKGTISCLQAPSRVFKRRRRSQQPPRNEAEAAAASDHIPDVERLRQAPADDGEITAGGLFTAHQFFFEHGMPDDSSRRGGGSTSSSDLSMSQPVSRFAEGQHNQTSGTRGCSDDLDPTDLLTVAAAANAHQRGSYEDLLPDIQVSYNDLWVDTPSYTDGHNDAERLLNEEDTYGETLDDVSFFLLTKKPCSFTFCILTCILLLSHVLQSLLFKPPTDNLIEIPVEKAPVYCTSSSAGKVIQDKLRDFGCAVFHYAGIECEPTQIDQLLSALGKRTGSRQVLQGPQGRHLPTGQLLCDRAGKVLKQFSNNRIMVCFDDDQCHINTHNNNQQQSDDDKIAYDCLKRCEDAVKEHVMPLCEAAAAEDDEVYLTIGRKGFLFNTGSVNAQYPHAAFRLGKPGWSVYCVLQDGYSMLMAIGSGKLSRAYLEAKENSSESAFCAVMPKQRIVRLRFRPGHIILMSGSTIHAEDLAGEGNIHVRFSLFPACAREEDHMFIEEFEGLADLFEYGMVKE